LNLPGDDTLVERRQSDVDVRFDEDVWRARDRAIQSPPQEQARDRLLGIACERLQLAQRRLLDEDLTEAATARLERRDDVMRVAKRFPQD
jgi:hypothetical protein